MIWAIKRLREFKKRVADLERRMAFIELYMCKNGHKWKTNFYSGKVFCERCGRMMTERDVARHFTPQLTRRKFNPLSNVSIQDDENTEKNEEENDGDTVSREEEK